MTADIDREKLRELCERATPGPWLLTDDGLKVYVLHHNGDYRKGQPVLVNRMYMQIDPCLAQGGSIAEAKAVCRLIAAARTALPALLDLTNAQAAENEKIRTFARDTQVICDAQAAKIEELEAENARLKEETDLACDYAREITKTLTNIVGGGSEMFAGRLFKETPNEMYKADLQHCERRLRERFTLAADRADEAIRNRREAESERDQLRKQVEAMTILDQLRADEGNCITLLCDNPDFNGQPNCAIEVCAEWTAWAPRRFSADTVLDCLRLAAASALEQKEQG